MRMSKLVGRRVKETPKDAVTASHQFLIRGGYVRPVSAGIYSLLPLAKRIVAKIERIIREEMDAIDGQEVLMPVVLPAELWEESGRYASVGGELLRFQDRNEKRMLLGMTHEEAVVHLARTELTSYKQLPAMLYQLQTKYRDEARPRAGLIRVREFTMKDAYSFHATRECLDAYYQRAHYAYERIFRRIGMPQVVSIESNPGMMGGDISHEFMALADCGEDTIFMSADGGYRANREVAVSKVDFGGGEPLPLEKVATPGKRTIAEVAEFLGVSAAQTGKAVFYVNSDERLVFAMIRGDYEVNESKLRNLLKVNELNFAPDERVRAVGAEPGYASPLALDTGKVSIVVDHSAAESANLVVGANEPGQHYRNFNFSRDLRAGDVLVADIREVKAGETAPNGEPLEEKRGIEVGNIFKLGTKYTAAMGATFLDQNGKAAPTIMGCYGIGVGRAMAAVVEQCHDEYGPIWPLAIAPYHVHLCALNPGKDGVGEAAEKLYREFQEAGLETIYDDRGEKAGFMFSDADLVGVPYRVLVSPKTLAEGKVELKRRGDRGDSDTMPIDAVVAELAARVTAELAAKGAADGR